MADNQLPAQYEPGKKRVQAILNELSSITVLGFQLLDSPPMVLFHDCPSTLVSRLLKSSSDIEVIAWIVDIIQKQGMIEGCFFMFEDNNKAAEESFKPWAKIKLEADYSWVSPLWALGHGFYFISLDLSYFLEIIYDEPNYAAHITRKCN